MGFQRKSRWEKDLQASAASWGLLHLIEVALNVKARCLAEKWDGRFNGVTIIQEIEIFNGWRGLYSGLLSCTWQSVC
jgi:hypothetical protein